MSLKHQNCLCSNVSSILGNWAGDCVMFLRLQEKEKAKEHNREAGSSSQLVAFTSLCFYFSILRVPSPV